MELKKPVHEVNFVKGIEPPIVCMLREATQTKLPPEQRTPHYHNYIEFLIGMDTCNVTAWVAGDEISFQTGDLLIINANVPHDFEIHLPISRYICIKVFPEVIYFSKNPMYDLKYVLPFLQHNLMSYQFFSQKELDGSGIFEAMKEMLQEWNEQKYGYEIALKSLFMQIFLWIIRYNRKKETSVPLSDSDVSSETFFLIQKSLEYINMNYAEVTEAEAAAKVNLSYSYYSRLFRRVVGKNFNDYLSTVRINEAERLLLAGELSVTEIAHATGFATSSHFIEKFRKIKKVTPKQYRMNWRG